MIANWLRAAVYFIGMTALLSTTLCRPGVCAPKRTEPTHVLTPQEVTVQGLSAIVSLTFRDKANKPIGSGTGIVVSQGIIVTCEHFIQGAYSMTANFPTAGLRRCLGCAMPTISATS